MFFVANSLSAANKLLIRCAWAGTAAFASTGYGSSWGPGTCPATFTSIGLDPSRPSPSATPASPRGGHYPSCDHPGTCPATFTSTASLKTAVKAYNTDPAAATAEYGLIADWDVSAVTDMSSLFYGLKNFNADISSWDTSGVTDMARMFQSAGAFNQPLSFDTSSVTTMIYMFYDASAFNQPLSFDTSGVINMARMFESASAFNQPLSFDTSSVTDMGSMFNRASVFNQPLSFDTSSVTNMYMMFLIAGAFNQPLSFDTSSVTNMGSMFEAANSLSAANKLLIRCAWAGTSAFASAGYGSSWGSGTCSALKAAVQAFDNVFTSTAELRTAAQEYNANKPTAIATYGPIADWDVSAVTDMSYLFYYLKDFNADISSWDTSGVTIMYQMFKGASAFNQPLSFDTSSVTNMGFMFNSASAFNQPLSFDTSSVTNMG